MSTTLTNGLKLPDKGSVDWYADMQNNYTILDGAVGTIADHTTAIAGKAASSHTHTKSDVTDLLNSDFIPSANNAYDLGSSSYQWNNLYAKKTYTSLIKAATGDLIIQSNGTNKSVAIYNGTLVGDGGGIWLYGKDHANGSKVRLQIYNTTTSGYEGVDLSNSSLYPAPNTLLNLGTSTNKWKTLNGINPGALSLPSENASSVNLDPTNWNLTGTSPNYYTPPANGWLGVQVMSADTTDLTGQFLFAGRATGGVNYYSEGGTTSINVNSGQGTLMGQVFIPVISGKLYHIRVKIGVDLTHGSSITARFYPCLGNV